MVASPVPVVCRVGVTGERVEVLFVDFGNVDVVSMTALKALPPQLMMLPMQVSDLRVCALQRVIIQHVSPSVCTVHVSPF